nr:DUF5714 domain-containing protein [uncultured Cellulosilyticum sp.]
MIIGKCLKCNGELKHSDHLVFAKCTECGVEEKTYIQCENGHYYCNTCASKSVINKLYKMVPLISQKNPCEIAEMLFVECGICGNSPHPLTTAAFLIAYKNLTGKITDNDVYEGIDRALKIPGGWCGYYGNCGAAVGLGVAFAIINKSTPMSDEERNIANIATAEGLLSVADQGGPRCCTASVRRVLEKSIEVANTYLNVSFPLYEHEMKPCWQSKYNDVCRHNKCKYFKGV